MKFIKNHDALVGVSFFQGLLDAWTKGCHCGTFISVAVEEKVSLPSFLSAFSAIRDGKLFSPHDDVYVAGFQGFALLFSWDFEKWFTIIVIEISFLCARRNSCVLRFWWCNFMGTSTTWARLRLNNVELFNNDIKIRGKFSMRSQHSTVLNSKLPSNLIRFSKLNKSQKFPVKLDNFPRYSI